MGTRKRVSRLERSRRGTKRREGEGGGVVRLLSTDCAQTQREKERARQCVGEQLRAKRFIPFNVYLCACMRGTILQKGVGCV